MGVGSCWGLADIAGADVGGFGGLAFVVAAVADDEAVDVDGHADPGFGGEDLDLAGGAEDGGGEDGLVGVGLVEDDVDLVLRVGSGHVGGGLEGDAHAVGFGEGGVAEGGVGGVALGDEERAVVDLGLAAGGEDGGLVDHGEVVEGRDEGLDPAVFVEAEVGGGLEGLGELDEGLEAQTAVEDVGGELAGVSFLGFGGHSTVDLFAVDESAIDLADAAGLFAEDGTCSSCHSLVSFKGYWLGVIGY